MEVPGESKMSAKLQRLKTELKEWEREFQMQNGRVPKKADIQASPSIHLLYREYARMKLKIHQGSQNVMNSGKALKVRGTEEKENAQTCLLGEDRAIFKFPTCSKPENTLRSSCEVAKSNAARAEPDVQLPTSRSLIFPSASSNSEESEDGSYVSATPPKRITKVDQQSTPVSSYRPVRRPLQEISAGRLNERIRAPTSSQSPAFKVSDICGAVKICKRKTAENDAPQHFTSSPPLNASDGIRSNEENTRPRPEFSQGVGFVIKRQRPGRQLEKQSFYREHDVLPAGFSLSLLGSNSIWKDYKKPTGVINQRLTPGADIMTLGTPNTANSSILSPSVDTQENSGGSGDTYTQLNSCFHVGSSPNYASPKQQDECATAAQQVSSNLQPELELAGKSKVPANCEAEAEVTCRDLVRDVAENSLQKLTIVTLKQMLLKRGLPVVGNKATLILRLSTALSAEADSYRTSLEKLDQGSCEQIQKVRTQLAEQTKKSSTIGTGKEEFGYDAEKVGLERSQDSVGFKSLRSGKLPSTSPALSTRSGTRRRRLAVTTDENIPSSSEAVTDLNSDSTWVSDVEVAGSIRTSKRVKKRSPQGLEVPVTEQDASHSHAITSCIRNLSANVSGLGKIYLPDRMSVASDGDVNDGFAAKMSNKRIKGDKQPEEQSWSKPKALQGRPRSKSTKTTSGRNPCLRKSQALKPGERNNFVKLNINGRGGGRRKFVNKTHFRKPGAYGRRGYHGRKFRRPALDEEDDSLEHDLLQVDEVYDADAVETKRLRSKKTRRTVAETDISIDEDAAHSFVPDSAENSKTDTPPGLSEARGRVLCNPSNDNLLEVLELAFGFNAFRAGQLEAVKRVLALQSTLVMLPTGAGKSLCYQLPALVLPGITLVISPLIALMTDQLRHLPPSLPGAVLSSTQTSQESSRIIARLRAGLIKVLFISPERLCSENFQRILTEVPKIHLAVVDEAHCLSEWSHNFRPSYFRLGSVLLQQMKVPCVLAMTATATKKAERSIMEALRIPSAGVIQASSVRDNLVLTVSTEPNRRRALLRMLQESPYSEARSIIIYCTFQVEADNVSDFLQQSGIHAKSYHSKKTSQERSRILDHFCSNKLRVVVATVAFGMGLDKSDVRAVIHYNMPRSLEHYVQETGRAGRDGKPAFCHLFLEDNDYLKLRSLAHSEGVDEYAVGKVLSRIFHGKLESSKLGSPSSIIIEAATKEFDMKEEVLETILSYLEVGEAEHVKSVSKLHVTCNLTFHRSSPASLADTSRLIATILQKSQMRQGRYVFNMLCVATHLELSICDMQSELRRLQVAGEISCEYDDPAFCFTVSKLPEDVCHLTSTMTKRLNDVETCKVRKVDAMYKTARAALRCKDEEAVEESTSSRSQHVSFQDAIKHYFDGAEDSCLSQQLPSVIEPNRNFLRADIKDFVRSNKHVGLTGRAVARIFYGIWSPAFTYSDWSKNHSWGKYEGVDFRVIKDVATAELLTQHSATRALQQ